MNFDNIESLEDCIKIYQCNKKYLFKCDLESEEYWIKKKKYLDNLNCWFVCEKYINEVLFSKK